MNTRICILLCVFFVAESAYGENNLHTADAKTKDFMAFMAEVERLNNPMYDYALLKRSKKRDVLSAFDVRPRRTLESKYIKVTFLVLENNEDKIFFVYGYWDFPW